MSAKYKRFLAILLISGLVTPYSGLISGITTAMADDTYSITVKKQPEQSKDIKKWSLQEFLDTQDRTRLMDLWLALHTPKPYEFFFNFDSKFIESSTAAFPADSRLSFSAFASIFGLSLERETMPSRLNLLFLFRVFGFRNQATHLTVHFGLRNQYEPSQFRSAFAGIATTLYFTKYFGVEAMYRYYYAAIPANFSNTFEGYHFEGNAFIDFSSLRIFGGYLRQTDDQMNRVGFQAGLRVFF